MEMLPSFGSKYVPLLSIQFHIQRCLLIKANVIVFSKTSYNTWRGASYGTSLYIVPIVIFGKFSVCKVIQLHMNFSLRIGINIRTQKGYI